MPVFGTPKRSSSIDGAVRFSRPRSPAGSPDRQGQAITNLSKALAPAGSDIAHQILNDPCQFDGLSVDNA